MPAQYPGIGFPPDSTVNLLRKICNNTAEIVNNGGGGGGGGVTSITAGSGISVDQATGHVTITNTSPGKNSNFFDSVTNNAGNTIVTPSASNYALALTFTGAAGNRTIILSTAGRAAGDSISLVIAFPATPGIIVDVVSGVGGAELLPTESFAANEFTTDGNVLSANWDFVFDGAQWRYVMSSIPA